MKFINATAVKTACKEFGSSRAHKLERVSREYLEELDAHVLAKIEADVRQAPSIGKTLYPKIRKAKEVDNG